MGNQLPTMSAAEAERQGFTLDEHCNPPVAYKGPRFDPDAWCYVESSLSNYAQRVKDVVDKNKELQGFLRTQPILPVGLRELLKELDQAVQRLV